MRVMVDLSIVFFFKMFTRWCVWIKQCHKPAISGKHATEPKMLTTVGWVHPYPDYIIRYSSYESHLIPEKSPPASSFHEINHRFNRLPRLPDHFLGTVDDGYHVRSPWGAPGRKCRPEIKILRVAFPEEKESCRRNL